MSHYMNLSGVVQHTQNIVQIPNQQFEYIIILNFGRDHDENNKTNITSLLF